MRPIQPFRTTLTSTLDAGAPVSAAGSFRVPGDGTLVIETVAVELSVPANQQVLFVRMGIGENGVATSFPIPVEAGGTASAPGQPAETYYRGLHRVRIYAGPESQISFSVGRTSASGEPAVTCSVAGRIVADAG